MTHNEKEKLEISAIKYFINGYPTLLTVVEHSDKPDFILFDKKNMIKIGVEIAHLWHDKEEVMMLLNRTEQRQHGVMCHKDLIKKLNNILEQKSKKIVNYKTHDKLFLVIRVASPIFDKSTFDVFEEEIVCPKNDFNEIWLVLDDNNKSIRWSELKKIK
jgi:hypothetical protein